MDVILIGYRGTGKTTVARLLAARFNVDWWDADQEIQRRAGKTIKEIFTDEGEAGFRIREEQVIAELVQPARGILAVGGGAILRSENRGALRSAVVVWLTAQPPTIYTRVVDDPVSRSQRPNLTTSGGIREIEAILAEREPLYRRCADHIVSTECKTAEQVATEIVCLLSDP